jgi:hypothetical protein
LKDTSLQKQVEKNTLGQRNEKEDITLLEVVWYETFNDKLRYSNCQKDKLQDFFDQNGRLPRWNVF